MVSGLDLAKRALVSLMKRFALLYAVDLDLTRESPDAAVRTGYRKLSVKTHPDRGGAKRERERRATTDEGRGTRDEGRGATSGERQAASDERRATRDEGRGTRAEGRVTRDEECAAPKANPFVFVFFKKCRITATIVP